MLWECKKYHYHNKEPLPSYNKVTEVNFIDSKAAEKFKRSGGVASLQIQPVHVCVWWGEGGSYSEMLYKC